MISSTRYVVSEYFVAQGVWETTSAFHTGGERDESSDTDMHLLVDAKGRHLITGASIAGAARAYLARRLQPAKDYRTRTGARWQEPNVLRAMLGDDFQSLATILDATEIGSFTSSVRDGIQVDSSIGIAEDERKFTVEILPAGARFRFEFWLRLYEQNPFGVGRDEICRLFRTMLEGFSSPQGIRLGARTRAGWGRVELKPENVTIVHFDLQKDLDLWLDEVWLQEPWLNSHASQQNRISLDQLGKPYEDDHRRLFTIDAELSVKTSVLVRSASEALDSPDLVHVSEAGAAPIPGTTVKGVIRSSIERIAHEMLEKPEDLLTRMLGPRKGADNIALESGRLHVEEEALQGGDLRVEGRNSIDRFSGATLDTALFTEAAWRPYAEGATHWEFRCWLELPEDEDTGNIETCLLLQSFMDLWLGDLTLGGEAGCGRGVFQGIHAVLTHPDLGRLEMTRTDDPRNVHAKADRTDGLELWAKIGKALEAEKKEVRA